MSYYDIIRKMLKSGSKSTLQKFLNEQYIEKRNHSSSLFKSLFQQLYGDDIRLP